jgi:hypothetical protein
VLEICGIKCRYLHDICSFIETGLHTTREFTDSLFDTWNTSQTSKLIKVAMTNTSIQVKVQEQQTDIIIIAPVLKQGDRMTALLQFSTLKYVVRQINIDKNKTIAYKSSQIMA